MGEKNILVALPPHDPGIYDSVIENFEGNGLLKKEAGDIKNADIGSSSVIILGADNPLAGRIFGNVPSEDAGFLLIVKGNPFNPQKVIGIINGKSKTEVEAASGKLSHYGKYSKLLFENGRNTSKQIEQTERGIVMATREDAPVVDISAIKKLSDVIDRVSERNIIYVGEGHDMFAHHLVQLDVIRGLYGKNHKIAIGMEMFYLSKTLGSFTPGT
jgi:hypothetical protein